MKEIIKDFTEEINPRHWVYRSKKLKPYIQEIKDQTSFLPETSKLGERFYCILNDIDNIPKCNHCNNPVKYLNGLRGYQIFCSLKCSANTKSTHQKRIKTNLKRYGYSYTSQNPEVKQKKIDTYFKETGFNNPSQNPEVKQKIKDNYFKNTGFYHPLQNPDVIKKYTNNKLYSKVSQKLFWKIYNKISTELQEKTYFGEEKHEFGIYSQKQNKYYAFDFVISSIKKCIEFNGDLWHANPEIYNEDDQPNPFRKDLTSKEIWEHDKKKLDTLRNKGYQVLEIWEQDYKKNRNKEFDKCIKFLSI